MNEIWKQAAFQFTKALFFNTADLTAMNSFLLFIGHEPQGGWSHKTKYENTLLKVVADQVKSFGRRWSRFFVIRQIEE